MWAKIASILPSLFKGVGTTNKVWASTRKFNLVGKWGFKITLVICFTIIIMIALLKL